MKAGIELRAAALADLGAGALVRFIRLQVTNRVKFVENGRTLFRDDSFVDDWDAGKKTQVIEDLRRCILEGGFVAGAFAEGALIGFANIENSPLGAGNGYLELPYIHVSREYRGQGLGRKLFTLCCEAARQRGAGKLYIAAHPAVETQEFYAALGCVPAAEIIREILVREPMDIQLEYLL